ncbi:hypothetical protein [Olleya sp. YS]|uniref:hypothetical protein n=1 Tax=Olleya sp. YS TaxID=3028318 RepID=UPI0024341BAE|nr:hypothetical protein [Olleya sp. YS]WGD34546.1 hypothetical protein Ollyesu_12245 [Olleya sp. YS]
MSSCNCTGNTGGTKCSDNSYAICRKVGNKCMGECVPRDFGLKASDLPGNSAIIMAKLFLNKIDPELYPEIKSGRFYSEGLNNIGSNELNLLKSGEHEYINKHGKPVVVRFAIPKEIIKALRGRGRSGDKEMVLS